MKTILLNWYYFIDIDIFSYSLPKSEQKQTFNFSLKNPLNTIQSIHWISLLKFS